MRNTLLLIALAALAAGLLTTSAPAQAPAAGKGKAAAKGKAVPALPGFQVNPDRTVTFTLRAPDATAVTVAGDFGNAMPMTRDADGVWSATVGPLRPAIYNYNFTVNGARVLDPANPWLGSADRNPGSALFEVPGDAPMPWDPQPAPHGTLHIHYYNSKSFGNALRMVYVYTPPGYETSNQRYPALYLMHGAGGNESSWVTAGRANIILDNLIAQGKAKPMVVVMPYGRAGTSPTLDPFAPPPGADGAVMFPNDVVADVVPFAEKNYRLIADADHRAIAGLSMGGNQTLQIGLNHLDTFHAIGAFSPVIRMAQAEQDHAPAFADVAAANRKLKLFYIYCGVEDTLFESNKSFHALLDQKGIKHTFVETKEAHVWRNWRDYLADFAPRLFR
jgi:enterochelin esterase family protein